jgi:hypothetical protein
MEARSYQELLIPFYTETVKITYDSDLTEVNAPVLNDQSLVAHFNALSNSNYTVFLNSIKKLAKTFHLNDWMYYQLTRQALEQIFDAQQSKEVELASWFFLSQSGFDTRLAYVDDYPYLFVHTTNEVFEVPTISDNGKNYINLSSIKSKIVQQEGLFLLDYQPNSYGTPFSFQLEQLPSLRAVEKKVRLKFWYQNKWEELEVTVDEKIKMIMADYPIIHEKYYFDIPLSSLLSQSLLPQLQQYIENKSDWEATELLAAFTRSAFAYKEDKAFFGYSKPMAAEEVFLYPYSDCEDRSALFYHLIRELLDLPVLVLAYPKHMTVAVALPKTKPGAFYYKSKAYYICDPTGPVKSSLIGMAPNGYETSHFKVLMSSE